MTSQPNGDVSSESNRVDILMDVTSGDQLLPNILSTPSLTDALFASFSRTLPIRDLVRLRPVCKQFRTLVVENSIFATLARREDDSKDWYFPLLFDRHMVCSAPDASGKRKRARSSWKWCGVHHPATVVHTLPSLEHLPSAKIKFSDLRFTCLIGTTGSLLLFLLHTRRPTPWNAWNDRNPIVPSKPSPWIPLLVSNPLTEEYTELRAPANAKSTWWDYHGARLHLVEDEYANTYSVVLLFRDRVLVYKSASKCWTSSGFEERIPWGSRDTAPYHTSDYYDVPCAIVGGKLFYAELEVDGSATPRENAEMLSKGEVRVFEVNHDGGTWKPAVRLSLQRSIAQHLHDSILAFGFEVGSYGIEVVKCLGSLYVLIPASLDVSAMVAENIRNLYNLKDGTYADFGFVPFRFYVLRVYGDHGLAFGQVLIQLSQLYDRKYIQPIAELYKTPVDATRRNSWYRARGWGTVINIMVGSYLLEYDVVSGVTTTQVVEYSGLLTQQPDVSYRPCLYRKP